MSKEKIKERKRREKEARRAKIIESAKIIFLSNGFDNTTMETIAVEAELSKGSLYNYFESKDDLYLAVAAIAIRMINEFCEKIDTTVMTDIERLIAIGNAIFEFSEQHPDIYNLANDVRSRFFYVNISQKLTYGETLNRNEQEINIENLRYQKLILNSIDEAINNKSIRDDHSPLFLGCTLGSLTSGLIKELRCSRLFYENLGINIKDIIKLVFDWVSEGLKPR